MAAKEATEKRNLKTSSRSFVPERRSPTPSPTSFDQFVIELADALNTTLDLDALLARVAELVRTVIDYEIFAILLLNERTQELRMRFQIGHTPEVEKIRIKVGRGITGQAVHRHQAVLVNDTSREENYISANPIVRSELAVPLIIKNRVIGVIDIQAAQTDHFTEEHRRILTTVASRIAVAIENARLYTRVARQAQTLMVLNDISRELTSILNLDQLLKRIGDLLNHVIDYQMFSILLLDEKKEILQHRFSLRFLENILLKHDIPMGQGLVGLAASEARAVLVPDVAKDPRYILMNPETRSELCVPLIYKGAVIGVLDLEHTRRHYFNEDHVRTLTTLAAQIAIAIENARLYERIAKEEQRLERDLAMAREVQLNLLPQSFPALKRAALATRFCPAQVVGGDMYDFLEYSSTQTAIVLSDVSGKGTPAALYAALASGIVRSTALSRLNPADMLRTVNRSLHHRRLEAQFVSMIYAVWDDEKSIMRVANSGAPRPIYCHHGESQVVQATGLPLALFEDAEYDEVAIHAVAGDVFLFFSDGIVDAVNEAGEQFGRMRIEKVIEQHCAGTAEEIVDSLSLAIAEHSGSVPSYDDETVVAIKITPGPPSKASAKGRL